MLEAWDSLVGTLDAAQIEGMSFAFDADERMSWFYTPVERTGLARGSLNDRQREHLEAFLTTVAGLLGEELTRARPLLEAEQQTFHRVTWETPNQLRLIDETDQEWIFDLDTQTLE